MNLLIYEQINPLWRAHWLTVERTYAAALWIMVVEILDAH